MTHLDGVSDGDADDDDFDQDYAVSFRIEHPLLEKFLYVILKICLLAYLLIAYVDYVLDAVSIQNLYIFFSLCIIYVRNSVTLCTYTYRWIDR